MEDIWFSIETKVRSLVKSILEPTVRRVVEYREAFDKVYKTQDILTSRLDDLDDSMHKFNRKASTIDEVAKRISEFDSMVRLMDMRSNRDREEIKAEISSFQSKVLNFEEHLEVFDHLKDNLRTDITSLTYAINSVKNQTDEKFDFFKNELSQNLESQKNAVSKHEVYLLQIDKDLKKFSNEIGDNTIIVQSNLRTCEELSRKAKEIRASYKYMKKNVFDNIEKLRQLAIKTMNESQTSDRKIIDLINTEVPIKNAIMLSDTLFSVLNDPFQRHDLAKFQKNQLESISDSLLNPELRKMLEITKEKIEQVIFQPLPDKNSQMSPLLNDLRHGGRNKTKQRTIFVVKKEGEEDSQTKKMTQHPNSPLKTINEEGSNSKNSPLSMNKGDITEAVMGQIRKSEIINLRDYEVVKDELKLARYNSLLKNGNYSLEEQEANDSSFDSSYGPPIDYHPIIEQAKYEALAKIEEFKTTQVQENFNLHTSLEKIQEDLRENHKIAIQAVEKSAADGRQNLKEFELLVSQALSECTSALTMRKRDQSDFSREIKGLSLKIELMEKSFLKVQEKSDQVLMKFDYIVECLNIVTVLCRQDEIDRESIALMGYKESKPKGLFKPVISIDKQCLSCTGQASVVINAFKIACLAYSPSPVSYKDSEHTRKELLESLSELLKNFENNESGLKEVRSAKVKTTSNTKLRPISVPGHLAFIQTLQTPRVEPSVDLELSTRNKKKRGFLSVSIQQ